MAETILPLLHNPAPRLNMCIRTTFFRALSVIALLWLHTVSPLGAPLLLAQELETLEETSTGTIRLPNVSTATIEATLSKFFQFSSTVFSPDSLARLNTLFMNKFANVLADTNRAEYAGFYTHFTFGGNLSGFSTALASYPNTNVPATFTTSNADIRTASIGLTTDTPILFPLFRSRKKAQATGFRWGMNIEFQATDARFLASSTQARFPTGSGMTQATSADVRHGGFLSLTSAAFTPTLRYAFASGLSLQVGLRMGIVLSSRWTVEDSIASPTGAFLLQTDTSRRQETFTGNQITGLSIGQTSLTVGLGYTIAVDRSFHVRPELVMNIPLVAPTANGGWSNRTSLRAGLSVLFNTEKILPTPDTTFARDTTVIIVASNEEPRTLLLRSKSDVQPSAYPNDEPVKVFVSEHYERRVPKPKPLLSASVDAEFVLPGGQRKRSITVEAEKTIVSVVPLFPRDSTLSSEAVRKHTQALQTYFAEYGLNLRYQENQQINGTAATILADTVILAAALPQVSFMPRLVSEAELHGIRLSLWRTLRSQSSQTRERRIALFTDTTSFLAPKPFLWKPADAPELFIRPEERFTYRFSVLDDSNIEVPVDSGFISLHADASQKISTQSLKRTVSIYALNPALWAVYEAQPTLYNNITVNAGNRVRILASGRECNDTQRKADIERLTSLLRKHIPKADIRFNDVLCEGDVTFAAKKMDSGEAPLRSTALSYLFVVVER
ncbi:MAG: hypothetical protein JNN25_17355 [Candidatus Kapabacteria bacterium]|nr:hypothetical protein [Candidatus Kapabacteria bacterium]